MKIEIELTLEKPCPDLTDLIADRIYTFEFVDKKQNVTARIVDEKQDEPRGT